MELMDQLDNPKKVKGKNCRGKIKGLKVRLRGEKDFKGKIKG